MPGETQDAVHIGLKGLDVAVCRIEPTGRNANASAFVSVFERNSQNYIASCRGYASGPGAGNALNVVTNALRPFFPRRTSQW
jgi:hypothetical protein